MNYWKEKILEEMKEQSESWTDVINWCAKRDELSEPFTLWTKKRVYFPMEYDTMEDWVASIPRNPCNEPQSMYWP